MNKLIIPIIVIAIVTTGIGAFVVFQKPALPEPQKQTLPQAQNQAQINKLCGDGICDANEKNNPNLCPKDCQGQTTTQSTNPPITSTAKPVSQPTTTSTKQTNQIPVKQQLLSTSKDSPFGIFGPYVTLTAENPLKSVSKSDVNNILKDIGVKWAEEMPAGDSISEISKSGVNIYSRIGCIGKTPPYTSDQKCKDSISSIIKQYKDKIKYWEFATEPNGGAPPMGWKGYAKEYATDLKEAYTIIKAECPDCYVVFGGLTGQGVGTAEISGGPADFLKDAVAGGAGNYFDVFEFKQHGANADDYKEIGNRLTIFSKIFSDYGIDIKKKLVFIETATHDGKPSTNPGLKSQTQTQQAIGLLKYYVYSISRGIDKIFWNLIYERHNFGSTGATLPGARSLSAGSSPFDYYGLVNNQDNDGDSSKKLAYYTYKKMVEVLEGSDWNNIQTIQESDGVYVYKFTKQGKSIWVAWNDNSGSKQITISNISSGSVKTTEAIPKYESGKEVTDYNTAFNTETKSVQNGKITITLGDKPMFVEEK